MGVPLTTTLVVVYRSPWLAMTARNVILCVSFLNTRTAGLSQMPVGCARVFFRLFGTCHPS